MNVAIVCDRNMLQRNVLDFYNNFISSTPLLRIFYSWSRHKHGMTLLGEPGLPKKDVL